MIWSHLLLITHPSSAFVCSWQLPFVSSVVLPSANMNSMKASCFYIWTRLTASCFFPWFKKLIYLTKFSTLYHSYLHRVSISLNILSLILCLYLSLSCLPPTCYLSIPLGLIFLFFNTLWFPAMLWKWQTVSYMKGKGEKKKVCGWFLDRAERLRDTLHQMGLADGTGLTANTSSFALTVWIFWLPH